MPAAAAIAGSTDHPERQLNRARARGRVAWRFTMRSAGIRLDF
jgi:hypothetical protein